MPANKLSKDDLPAFKSALLKAWSENSSTLWTAENPAAGHCGVTALVANDLFGGEITKTRYGGLWHFYNVLDGVRHDFTESQFAEPIHYADTSSNRGEAFDDTNEAQYVHLRSAVLDRLGTSSK